MAELDLCVQKGCFNYSYIPSSDPQVVDCPKVYVSMDVLCSHCSATDINPTFTLQIYCLNVNNCSIQSWQTLKTFRRFIELDAQLRKEEDAEIMCNITVPTFPSSQSCSHSTKPSTSPRKIKSLFVPRNSKKLKSASEFQLLTVSDVASLRKKMLETIQLYIDQIMLSEILMFSPTLCRFFGIKENLGRIRIYTGNQLQDEIQANTELQLRKAIYFHERQLENQRNTLNNFLNSSEFSETQDSLHRLQTLKSDIEETTILLDACKLNLEVWLGNQEELDTNVQNNTPKASPEQERKLEIRQADLVLQLGESSSEIRSDMLFSPSSLRSSGTFKRENTFLNTSILTNSIRLQQPDSIRRRSSCTSIFSTSTSEDKENVITLNRIQELEDLIERFNSSVENENMFLANRFCKTIQKRILELEAEDNQEQTTNSHFIDVLEKARTLVKNFVPDNTVRLTV